MYHEIHAITDSDTESEKIKKILIVLARANSPVPLAYISLHTGIIKPLTTLRRMEKTGIVSQSPVSTWSSSIDPTFELMSATQKGLLDVIN